MAVQTIADAVSSLTPLKAELEALTRIVSSFKEEHHLSPKLSELPGRLRMANVCLYAANRQRLRGRPASRENRSRKRARLNRIAESRARAMGFNESDLARVDTTVSQ